MKAKLGMASYSAARMAWTHNNNAKKRCRKLTLEARYSIDYRVCSSAHRGSAVEMSKMKVANCGLWTVGVVADAALPSS
ncbi:unnamed protein product [Urochloa humidicola]